MVLTLHAGSLPEEGSPSPSSVVPVTRFLIDAPGMPAADALAISPDGRTLAYAGRDGTSTAVFVRPLGVDTPKKLAGTEGAARVFWSPDSTSIGFFAGGLLKTVDAVGGPPQSVCETADLFGATWNADGDILFASSAGLQRVLAAGGQPALVSAADGKERRLEPHFLPDGRHYLYLSATADGAQGDVRVGELDSTDAVTLFAATSNARYVAPGYLLFHREGTLYAQQFDADDLDLAGEPVRIAEGIPFEKHGAASFSASNTGVLIYRTEPRFENLDAGGAGAAAAAGAEPPLLAIGRGGRVERLSAAARWIGLDLSPDAKRAIVHRHEQGGGDLWIFELGQATPSRFTFDAAQDNSMPAWSPDGARIAFSSRRDGKWGVYVKDADNTTEEQLILASDVPAAPTGWTADGQRILYRTVDASRGGGDIRMVDVGGEHKTSALLTTPADERNAQVSPDGKWLAYSSNESGRSEIYIKPFPEGAGRIQVSVNGGVFPRWRRDSREVYFMSLVSFGSMMASELRVGGSAIQRSVPRQLFQTAFVSTTHTGGPAHAYAAGLPQDQFLIPQLETPTAAFGVVSLNTAINAVLPAVTADRRSANASSASNAPITVVLDWTTALPR